MSTRLQPVHGFVGADADAAHLAQRSGKRAALAAGLAAQLQRDAAALAVVGFGKIDEFEIESEGAGEQDGALDGQRVHKFERLCGVAGGFSLVAARLGIAAANGALAQRFNVRKEVLAGLLAQHFAQQHAQRAHIAAQRRFFQSRRSGLPTRPGAATSFRGSRVRPSCFDYARRESRFMCHLEESAVCPSTLQLHG